jgi:hypothetical protein
MSFSFLISLHIVLTLSCSLTATAVFQLDISANQVPILIAMPLNADGQVTLRALIQRYCNHYTSKTPTRLFLHQQRPSLRLKNTGRCCTFRSAGRSGGLPTLPFFVQYYRHCYGKHHLPGTLVHFTIYQYVFTHPSLHPGDRQTSSNNSQTSSTTVADSPSVKWSIT